MRKRYQFGRWWFGTRANDRRDYRQDLRLAEFELMER